jgi:hypothetical protein
MTSSDGGAVVDRVGLAIRVGAVRRFAMTVSGRVDSPPGGPSLGGVRAVCTITDQFAPNEPPLQGALKLADDGSFTFTLVLEPWPEERYPQGRFFAITVRAQDEQSNVYATTTHLRVPPAGQGPVVTPPAPAPKVSRAAPSIPPELVADAVAQPVAPGVPVYAKGLHLAVKELREERADHPSVRPAH